MPNTIAQRRARGYERLAAERDSAIQRAEAAEARAADEELRAKSWHDSAMTLADQRDAAYKRNTELEAERDEARSTCERMNEMIKKIAKERGDAREERDEARRQLSEAMNREQMDRAVMTEASEKITELRQEARDSAGRVVTLLTEMEHAQCAIDVLSQTVVAQDAEIKRLRQRLEDVDQYRAEIERLHQAATA